VLCGGDEQEIYLYVVVLDVPLLVGGGVVPLGIEGVGVR